MIVPGHDGRHFGDQVFANLHPYFSRYIEERRASPRDDVMSRLASVRFSDGELPEVMDVVRLATIIFAAGQETTARLLTAAMRKNSAVRISRCSCLRP